MGFFTAAILLVSSYLLTALAATRPSTNPQKPSEFDPGQLPVASEGTEQIVVFGDCNVSEWMVLGYGNYRTKAIKAGGSSGSGGKK